MFQIRVLIKMPQIKQKFLYLARAFGHQTLSESDFMMFGQQLAKASVE